MNYMHTALLSSTACRRAVSKLGLNVFLVQESFIISKGQMVLQPVLSCIIIKHRRVTTNHLVAAEISKCFKSVSPTPQ